MANAKTIKIRDLNDAFRTSFQGGKVVLSAAVNDRDPDLNHDLFGKVRGFDAFSGDNDPYGEHDFGSLDIAGDKFFWKIDYYDKSMEFGSEDASDPTQTTRVLTIMYASDY